MMIRFKTRGARHPVTDAMCYVSRCGRYRLYHEAYGVGWWTVQRREAGRWVPVRGKRDVRRIVFRTRATAERAARADDERRSQKELFA